MRNLYRTWTLKTLLALLGLALLSPVYAAPAQKKKEKKDRTVYAATIVGVRGRAGGMSHGMTLRIAGTTPDELVAEYLKMVQEKDYRGLRHTLEKVRNLGNIAMDGFVGTDIAVVREHQTDNGKLINILTARNMPFIELYHGGRSTDYPFSLLQILVDEDGKGQGSVIVSAKISFNKEGVLEIESFGLQPFQLVNVRRY